MDVEEESVCGHLLCCPCQALCPIQCQLIPGCLPFLHSLQPVCLPCYSPSSPSHPLHKHYTFTNYVHLAFYYFYYCIPLIKSRDFQSKWCEIFVSSPQHVLYYSLIFTSIYPFLFYHASEPSFLPFTPFWNPLHDSLMLKPSWSPPPYLQPLPVYVLCACCASLTLQQCEQRPQ